MRVRGSGESSALIPTVECGKLNSLIKTLIIPSIGGLTLGFRSAGILMDIGSFSIAEIIAF